MPQHGCDHQHADPVISKIKCSVNTSKDAAAVRRHLGAQPGHHAIEQLELARRLHELVAARLVERRAAVCLEQHRVVAALAQLHEHIAQRCDAAAALPPCQRRELLHEYILVVRPLAV